MAGHNIATAGHDNKPYLELTVAQGDTETVRDFLLVAEARGLELTEMARIAKAEVRTISRWKQNEKKGEPQSINKTSRAAIQAYMNSNAPPEQKAVALSILSELRAKLDELESRLSPDALTQSAEAHEAAQHAVESRTPKAPKQAGKRRSAGGEASA